jgi:hypothetical protein
VLFCSSASRNSTPCQREQNQAKTKGPEPGLSLRIFPPLCPSVDRSCLHRDRDFAAQTLRLEDEPRLAGEFGRDTSFYQLGPKTALLRRNHIRPSMLDPFNP